MRLSATSTSRDAAARIGVAVDADLPRHRGLVVADAGDAVQQGQRPVEGLFATGGYDGRRPGKTDALDQLWTVVKGIDQPRLAVGQRPGSRRVGIGHHPRLPQVGARHPQTRTLVIAHRMSPLASPLQYAA